MNDEVENLLQRLTPRGPDIPVRAQVQAAMERELARPGPVKWERRLAWSAAAAVLLGIALNYAAIHADNQRQARYGTPLPAEVQETARMVESVSDAETGQWVTQQYRQARQRRVSSRA
ncbi:MAG TPA: hypothetical protein VKS79_10890, partial [Gemmataceae bacterium]|nr:hypothetical protein [Gemmataceae bacterium]